MVEKVHLHPLERALVDKFRRTYPEPKRFNPYSAEVLLDLLGPVWVGLSPEEQDFKSELNYFLKWVKDEKVVETWEGQYVPKSHPPETMSGTSNLGFFGISEDLVVPITIIMGLLVVIIWSITLAIMGQGE